MVQLETNFCEFAFRSLDVSVSSALDLILERKREKNL
jgi:hypothetical protein